MLTRLYSPAKNEEGFTLIELLIVVIIIGILAAIALPIFLNQQKAAADAAVKSDVRNTLDNVQTWEVQNQGKVEANTGAFVTDGGKAVITGTNTVGVTTASDGSYTVCGYGATGKNSLYTSASAAYTYDSKTGVFGTGTCVSGSDTGGTGTGGTVVAAGSPTLIDFENPATGAIAGTVSGGTVVADGTAHSPTHAWKNQGGTSLIYTFNTPLVVGKTYTVTVWANNTGSSLSSLQGVEKETANGTPSTISGLAPQTINPGSGWFSRTGTFTPTSAVTFIEFDTGSQTTYIDDISIVGS